MQQNQSSHLSDMETWLIILIVVIGIIFLAALGIGLYFLFRPKTPIGGLTPLNPVKPNGGGNGGGSGGGGGGNGGGGGTGGLTPLNPVKPGGGGGNKCIIPVLNLIGVIGIDAGDQVVFRFIFDNPNLPSPPSSYTLELSSDNFSTVSTTGIAGDSSSVRCSPAGCAIQVGGSAFAPAVFSTSYSARMRIVDKNCGSGDPSNVVPVTTR